MLRLAARTHLMLWPAALALLALVITWVGIAPGGWAGTLAWGVTFSLGLPFVLAAETVAGWLGPARGTWILPVSIPFGLLPYLAADLLVHHLARHRALHSPTP